MTDGEPKTVVSASLQKIKSIKNPINFYFIYFIKSETSDSFVSHFDGHFAYLKTLDFYFKDMQRFRAFRFKSLCPWTVLRACTGSEHFASKVFVLEQADSEAAYQLLCHIMCLTVTSDFAALPLGDVLNLLLGFDFCFYIVYVGIM